MRYVAKSLLMASIIVLLAGCGTNNTSGTNEENEEKTEKIEAYIAETVSHEEGDYKLVNSQIILSGSGENIKVEARIIEDFFNEEGDHIKTRLLHSTAQNGDEEVFIDEPMTILLKNEPPENGVVSEELSTQEKAEIKNHILKVFEDKF